VIATKRLAAVDHLADVEAVAQQIGERPDPEGAAPDATAGGELTLFGADAVAFKVLRQRLHGA
jgi:hypothetical protein